MPGDIPSNNAANDVHAGLLGFEGKEVMVHVVEDRALEEDRAVHVVGKVLLEGTHLLNLHKRPILQSQKKKQNNIPPRIGKK